MNSMYHFVRYQLQEIIKLKSDKHFYFALLLSLKFILMSATISAYLYITLMTDVSWAKNISDYYTVIWAGSAITLFILVGKYVIQFHMKVFDAIDEYFRKFIDWYSIRYWKKNKKDSPILSGISKVSTKLFGWYYKMPPKRRKMLLFALIFCYGTYFILINFVDDLALAIDHAFPELDDS